MKINYFLVSRSLIALLFVVAGIQKIMNFGGTVGYVDSLHVPFPLMATILVIIVEVPIALMFAYGYRVCATGSALIAFIVMATLLAHHDFSVGQNMTMALKNIAIIGGIMAIIKSCDCEKCAENKKH